MSSRTEFPDTVHTWLAATTIQEHPQFALLRAETDELPMARMRIGPEQCQLMGWLTRLIGARRTLEVGTFTGSSALAVALALPEDGSVVALDLSDAWTAIARRHWQAAGVSEKIALRLGPGVDSLQTLLDAGEEGRFDLAFIDADKGGYLRYYELCLALVRPGGLVLLDNALWGGRVADPTVNDPDTVGIRTAVLHAVADPRVDAVLLPMGDGILIARKKETRAAS